MIFLQCDVQKVSFNAAFDVDDGRHICLAPRADVPTWSTPTIHGTAERLQLIANGYKHIGGYDVRTGRELWKLTGGGDIPVRTPVIAYDLAFITNAHASMARIYADRLSATGDMPLQRDAR